MAEKETTYKGESHIRSILKSFSWRIIAFLDTLLVTLIVTWIINGTPEIHTGLKIAGIEFFIKIVIFYFHERAWQIGWKSGEFTPKETLFKTFTWRIIATTSTFIISGKVIGAFAGAALAIALTESISKFILFYWHERLWIRIPLGTLRKVLPKNRD